jgi:hypothetical protein
LARYAAELDAELANIEETTKVELPPFPEKPPMTLDDELHFESVVLPNGVPMVASRFESMTGVMTGIALRLDGIPHEDVRYLSLMPALLTEVGVIIDGRPLSYEDMSERLRCEILDLSASFAHATRTGRVELVLRGSGVGLGESRKALEWMERTLHAPDWRVENLPRIRDVVDQQLAELRDTMQDKEEYWGRFPERAWRMQHHPAYLATESFLTRTYNALRLRWQLIEPEQGDCIAVTQFLKDLVKTASELDRRELEALLSEKLKALEPQEGHSTERSTLSKEQRELAVKALRDIDLSLSQVPDTSLRQDFSQLAFTLLADLAMPASEALKKLDATWRRVLSASGARMFLAASQKMRGELSAEIEWFAGRLSTAAFTPAPTLAEGLISTRLRLRGADSAPRHVGLHAPNKQGGMIWASAPSLSFADGADEEGLLDYLATCLYAGGGSHSAFSKTIGAGFAYSNGVAANLQAGTVSYYAERTPDLAQTVRFVVDLVKNGKPDRALRDYVMTQVFKGRGSNSYEDRAESMAEDIADGETPERVRSFRQAALKMRDDPDLVEKLFERKDRAHARLLPGYQSGGLDPDGTFFVIGPDKQLNSWEKYLKEVEGASATLQVLYGRDFWMR